MGIEDIVIQKIGTYNPNWKTLYVDIDDCFIKTSECIIKILQRRFQDLEDKPDFCDWSVRECLSHLVKWDYSNFIQGRLTRQEIQDIFNSEEFWNTIKIDDDFLAMINDYSKYYNIIFVSKGQEKNLKRKEQMLIDLYSWGDLIVDVGFIGIKNGKSKSVVDMSNGVQIDDNYKYLEDTNARVKILYRNKYCNTSNYNGVEAIDGQLDNLYVTEFVDEIEQILSFDSSYFEF